MEANEMAGWAGTPGLERIAMAEWLLEKDPGSVDEYARTGNVPQGNSGASLTTYYDANKILGLVDIFMFSLHTHEEIELMGGAGQINSGMDLLEIAREGSSQRYISMVIHMPPDEGEDEATFIITCLHRHPEWVGLNPQLPNCSGLDVHIFCRDHEPRYPKAIIAVPPGAMDRGQENGEKSGKENGDPEGEMNLAIRDTVLWHGAARCLQHS